MSTTAREQLLDRVIAHIADNGIGDASLRAIGAGAGSSHRMLLHHFGSRDGLLAAVVQRVDDQLRATQQRLLAELTDDDAMAGAWAFWRTTADTATRYGPLFFELMTHATQGKPHAAVLRSTGVQPWVSALAGFWTRAGVDPAAARRQARLDLAVARGLLLDLLLTGDRDAVDTAMRDHVDRSIAALIAPS